MFGSLGGALLWCKGWVMPSVNVVVLAGHMTRTPELRYTPNSKAVCDFGLAVNRSYKGGEEVVFVDIQMWGRRAEVLAERVGKGEPILVRGRLCLDQWEDKKSGRRRQRVYVTAEDFNFIGGSNRSRPAGNAEEEGEEEGEDGGSDKAPF